MLEFLSFLFHLLDVLIGPASIGDYALLLLALPGVIYLIWKQTHK